jgi:hypothetical protein
MEELQNGLSERAQWFRIGMISATVLTPLITRWRSLRAAQRARDLWESSRAGARWPWAASPTEAELPPVARRQPVSTGIWLAGAGVGLVVAGTVAFVVARRRIMSSDEAPLELTLEPGSNGAGRSSGERTREAVGRATWTSAANVAARDLDQDAAEDAAEDAALPPTPAATEPQTAALEEAQYIGDVKTLVYHDDDDDDNLPTEENRVYFATREQAEAAGFRPVKGEVAR